MNIQNLAVPTLLLFYLLLHTACQQTEKAKTPPAPATYPSTGRVERLDPALDALIAPDARIEILADSFKWSEGPVWAKALDALLFTDVPANTVYKWREKEGKSVYLQPSGYTGTGTYSREPGANGLTIDAAGKLVLCQHGDRRVARMDAILEHPASNFVSVAESHNGKRFNSPNDLVYDRAGRLYFTDPPYGLPQQENDPSREIPIQGVYRRDTDGSVTLLTELTRPNGIAFSPDQQKLYVANSDPAKAIWMVYDVKPDGSLANGKVFYDATPMVKDNPGLPDGLKVDAKGNLFATGPGGVLVFDPSGKLLGIIRTGQPTANCAFDGDGSTLFMTANMFLMRIKLTRE